MNTSNRNVLIVCYDFPPIADIGGRRWAKFAKYLAKKSVTVHVIAAEFYGTNLSPWYSDVKDNPNINIHRLPLKYFQTLMKSETKNVYDKVKYRISEIICRIYSKGTPYDRALFWKQQFLKKTEEVIQNNNIRTIIVTGAPFRLTYYSTFIKDIRPDINLIVDFRDPWIWGKLFGYSTISKRRRIFEEKMQNKVVEYANTIFVPYEEMSHYLQAKYQRFRDNIKILPHGYDEEEISLRTNTSSSGKSIRLVMYGTLYNDIDRYILKVAEFINAHRDRITLDIYTSNTSYSECFQSFDLLDKNVFYKPIVSSRDLFISLQSYDYVLVINPDRVKNFISTKFYELVACNMPIIYLAENGVVSDFIKSENLGLHFDYSNTDNLNEIFSIDSKKFISNFEIERFSFSFLTNRLLEYIN